MRCVIKAGRKAAKFRFVCPEVESKGGQEENIFRNNPSDTSIVFSATIHAPLHSEYQRLNYRTMVRLQMNFRNCDF